MVLARVLVVAGMFFTGCAVAGEQTGKVKELVVRNDGLHYFWLQGEPSGKPVCARNAYWMIQDENSAAGKSQLSIILSAQAQQKSVRVVGTGSCTRWSDGEDISYISIQ